MSVPAPVATPLDVARAFADAYARGKAPEVALLLAIDVHEREITPGGIVDQRGRDAVIAEATAFLRPYAPPEVLSHVVEPLGHLVRWSTRWRIRSNDASWLIEWHAYLTVRDGLITNLDVVCSGRVAERAAPAPTSSSLPKSGARPHANEHA
ncbi:MAG TPA: nuclear transport factor 2 family protein [Solirubrobacteraceae bacterium]|nr:nuclear transport factor 2 family protein [Solirubrobacteraceae bacterium]